MQLLSARHAGLRLFIVVRLSIGVFVFEHQLGFRMVELCGCMVKNARSKVSFLQLDIVFLNVPPKRGILVPGNERPPSRYPGRTLFLEDSRLDLGYLVYPGLQYPNQCRL